MSGETQTRTVVRLLVAWNDEREERWLAEQERSGWRLKAVRSFGYTLERAAPAHVTYRLDFGPSARCDREEYFGLFRDAGWEHVGTRGLWQYFRKATVDGWPAEIYTDPQSRIAKYRRVMAFLAVMMVIPVTQIAPLVAAAGGSSTASRHPSILVVQLALITVLMYGLVRLALVISRLRRAQARQP